MKKKGPQERPDTSNHGRNFKTRTKRGGRVAPPGRPEGYLEKATCASRGRGSGGWFFPVGEEKHTPYKGSGYQGQTPHRSGVPDQSLRRRKEDRPPATTPKKTQKKPCSKGVCHAWGGEEEKRESGRLSHGRTSSHQAPGGCGEKKKPGAKEGAEEIKRRFPREAPELKGNAALKKGTLGPSPGIRRGD